MSAEGKETIRITHAAIDHFVVLRNGNDDAVLLSETAKVSEWHLQTLIKDVLSSSLQAK